MGGSTPYFVTAKVVIKFLPCKLFGNQILIKMSSTRAERLNEAFNYLRFKGLVKTQKDLAEAIGATAPNVSSALKGDEKFLTDSFIARFSEAFEEVSSHWLLTGEGEMLRGNEAEGVVVAGRKSEDKISLVPLLPIAAQGGSLNDFVVSVKENDCERVVSPIRGADFAMPVAGDSMAPEYPAGSQIFIKKINERAFIDWGKVYVLDTCNGSVIKRVFPSDNAEKVKCVSINPEYPPFEVSYEDIYGMYRVLLCMSVK